MKTFAVAAGAAMIAAFAGVSAFAQGLSPLPVAVTTAPPAPPPVITVYDKPNFKGNMLKFDRSVPSLAKLKFNDVIASVQIAGTRDWVLCEHRNFQGKCVRVHLKEKDLTRLKINGMVSSLYPVPATPPAPAKK